MEENLNVVSEETNLQEEQVENKEENMVENREEINSCNESNGDVITNENKIVKGVDIYVENDISKLERMLGVSSMPDEVGSNAQNVEHNVLEELENLDREDQVHYSIVEDCDNKEEKEVVEDMHINAKDVIESDIVMKSDPTTTGVQAAVKNTPVLLSDFMDLVEDEFTFLQKEGDSYIIESLPMDDRKRIQKAVKGKNYIFRYPKYVLRDDVLGYKETEYVDEKRVDYLVYFPDYSLSFTVPLEYKKPYSVSFVEYMNDLVARVRPDNLYLSHYTDSVTITNLKVIETGILELETSIGTDKYIQKVKEVSFYKVLDYIRELSDQGNDKLNLKLIPAYFTLL